MEYPSKKLCSDRFVGFLWISLVQMALNFAVAKFTIQAHTSQLPLAGFDLVLALLLMPTSVLFAGVVWLATVQAGEEGIANMEQYYVEKEE